MYGLKVESLKMFGTYTNSFITNDKYNVYTYSNNFRALNFGGVGYNHILYNVSESEQYLKSIHRLQDRRGTSSESKEGHLATHVLESLCTTTRQPARAEKSEGKKTQLYRRVLVQKVPEPQASKAPPAQRRPEARELR